MDLLEMVQHLKQQGYDQNSAESRVCQDVIIQALSNSFLRSSVTIKCGVVMRSISKDIRRATKDIDIDFIRYSLDDYSIEQFILKMNCIQGLSITRIGEIEELKQQEYHGKRVSIQIKDNKGNILISKIDLGVHTKLNIEQEEYCFEICFNETGVNMLINSMEQMFTEKLCSLLKFGTFSTKYKDIFDMYYLSHRVDDRKVMYCLSEYILNNKNMRENTIQEIIIRLNKIFSDKRYLNKLSTTHTNWLGLDISQVLNGITMFLNDLNEKK